jgi:tetratricopeptide (TPR) repeat protein
VGLGAFTAVFDAYRPVGVAYSPNFAHSEPLQGLAELGLPFLLVAVASMGLAVRRLRGALGSRSRVTWGALAALLAVAAHALVDFPLHVPAVALTAAALAGLLFAGELAGEPRLGPGATRALLAGLAVAAMALAGTQLRAVDAERRAAELMASGDFGAAATAAQAGLRARPDRAALWTLLADAAEHDARFEGGGPAALERAVQARRRAAASRRGDAALRRRAADTLARAGRLEEARVALEEAVRLDPRSPVGPLAQMRLALRRGDRAGAAHALRGAIGRLPRAQGRLLLAALRDTADPEVVRAAPVDGPTRAAVLAQSGFPSEAAAELERIFREDPGNPERALDAARLYRRAGESGAARRVLERAARLHPEHPRLSRRARAVGGGGAR